MQDVLLACWLAGSGADFRILVASLALVDRSACRHWRLLEASTVVPHTVQGAAMRRGVAAGALRGRSRVSGSMVEMMIVRVMMTHRLSLLICSIMRGFTRS